MQVNSIVQGVLFFCLMIYATFIDVKKREIPPYIWILVAIISLLDFKSVHLLGILAALPLLFSALYDPDGIGGGDIKLTAAAGLVIGFWKAVIGLFFGLILVLIYHVLTNGLYKQEIKIKCRDSYPLAPFLGVGFISVYFI